MLALAAVVAFTLAAIEAFGELHGISVTGLLAAGLACLAAHLAWPLGLGRKSGGP